LAPPSWFIIELVIIRNLSRRVKKLEKRAIPAENWMLVLGKPPVGQAESENRVPTLTVVLPRVS
jgi:hypothetical protein